MAELGEMMTNLGKNVPTKVAKINTIFTIQSLPMQFNKKLA